MILKMCYFFETTLSSLNGQFKLVNTYIVVHHATFPLVVWCATAYAPGGNSLVFGITNLLVHIIILSYVIATILFPSVKPPWSKKFFTWLQIFQFAITQLHGLQIVFLQSLWISDRVLDGLWNMGMFSVRRFFLRLDYLNTTFKFLVKWRTLE